MPATARRRAVMNLAPRRSEADFDPVHANTSRDLHLDLRRSWHRETTTGSGYMPAHCSMCSNQSGERDIRRMTQAGRRDWWSIRELRWRRVRATR